VSGLRDVASDGPSCIGVGLLLFAISCTPVAGPVTLVGPTLWEGMAKHMLYAAAAFFLLLPAFLGPHDSLVSRAMSVPPLRRLGQISYGVFLWHLLLLELLQPALGIPLFGGGFWRLWPITVGASIAVATVSWLVLESPVLTRAHAVREGGSSPPVKDRSPTGHPSGGS
jgi:peptidoglycan/LPS O-acetylase OafA/YrhL